VYVCSLLCKAVLEAVRVCVCECMCMCVRVCVCLCVFCGSGDRVAEGLCVCGCSSNGVCGLNCCLQ